MIRTFTLPTFTDERGRFRRTFCTSILADQSQRIEQTNISINPVKNTLRGFHFEKSFVKEAKFITLLTGIAYFAFVVVDPNSPNFGCIMESRVTADEEHVIFVPPGIANAFLTLTEHVTVSYAMTAKYEDCDYGHIFWSEKHLRNIGWPDEPKLLSVKDQQKTTYF